MSNNSNPTGDAIRWFLGLFVVSIVVGVIIGAPDLFAYSVGAAVVAAGVAVVVWFVKLGKVQVAPDRVSKALAFAFIASLLLMNVVPTFAQSTPVPLEIPTAVIFTETNNWLETFAPIAAIGIGITIALAVLGYLGKMIASAFKG